MELPALESLQPDGTQVEQVILRALGERVMGPATLLRVLTGDNTVDDRYRKLGFVRGAAFCRAAGHPQPPGGAGGPRPGRATHL